MQWLGFCRWQFKVIVVNGDDGQCWVAAIYPPFLYLWRSWLIAMVMVGIMLMIIESDGAVNDDGWCGGDSELSFTCSFLTSLLSPRHFLARLPSFSWKNLISSLSYLVWFVLNNYVLKTCFRPFIQIYTSRVFLCQFYATLLSISCQKAFTK